MAGGITELTLAELLRGMGEKAGRIGSSALYSLTNEMPEMIRKGIETSTPGAKLASELLRTYHRSKRSDEPEMREIAGYGQRARDPGEAFAGSILGDPTTYITAGAGAAIPKLAAKAAEEIAPKVPKAMTGPIRTAEQIELFPRTARQTFEQKRANLDRATQDPDATFYNEQAGRGWEYRPRENAYYVDAGPPPNVGMEARADVTRAHTQPTRRVDVDNIDPNVSSTPEAFLRQGAGEDFDRAARQLERVRDKTQDFVRSEGALNRQIGVEDRAAAQARIDQLRARGVPEDPAGISQHYRDLLEAKTAKPIIGAEDVYTYNRPRDDFTAPGRYDMAAETPEIRNKAEDQRVALAGARGQLQQSVRNERNIDEFVNPEVPDIEKPLWARELTDAPSAGAQQAPAGADWWAAQFQPPIEAFAGAARENPKAFQLGLDPGTSDIDEIARIYSQRSGTPIRVEQVGGYSDEPYKIEVPKEHGRGELMRDRWGEYKQFEKTHDRGDYPMYDESGEEKMKELFGPTKEEGEPLMGVRRAAGGEPMRDTYGDQKYGFKKSQGGEPMLDERGDQKYYKKENPDYRGDEDEGMRIYSPGKGHITVTDPYGVPNVDAMGAPSGDIGQLLYQTLYSHAAANDVVVGGNSLTPANQFRLLGNALSAQLRHGKPVRDVRGTLSGAMPRATGAAKTPELWRAEMGEADARLAKAGGDPDALTFDGEKFFYKGEPIQKGWLRENISTIAPGFKEQRLGEKSLMRSAVYKWLDSGVSSEQAAQAGRKWGDFGPLFASFAGATALGSALLGDNKENQNVD